MEHPFYDIQLIEKLDTRVNFLIKCESSEELEQVQKILSVSKRYITFADFKKTMQNEQNHHHQQLEIQFD